MDYITKARMFHPVTNTGWAMKSERKLRLVTSMRALITHRRTTTPPALTGAETGPEPTSWL
jgi:hypothetical protein